MLPSRASSGHSRPSAPGHDSPLAPRPAQPSSNTSRFGTTARGSIPPWTTLAQRSSSRFRVINCVHENGASSDPFRVVEGEVGAEGVEEFPRLADRIFVHLNELLGEGALVALDTAVDARAAWIAPTMGDVLGAEIGIEFTLELGPIIG